MLLYVLAQWYTQFWHAVVPWVGAHVLALDEPITVLYSGSGDKTFDYVFLSIAFTCSLVACWRAMFTALGRLSIPMVTNGPSRRYMVSSM
ncbi:hypothetical protein [Parapedobacter sp.]